MIQFKIFDSFLELRKDFSLSFSFVNPIFSFDKLELKRTQEFTIPATAHNNMVFELANKHDSYGLNARQILDAEMWYSGGKIDGKLHISSCTSQEYKCIFVFGELLKLKTIQDSGKIGKYYDGREFISWNDNTPTYNSEQFFALFKYRIKSFEIFIQSGWNYMPSLNLAHLITNCASILDVDIDVSLINDKIRRTYVKLNGMNLAGAVLADPGVITMIGTPLQYTGYPHILFDPGTIIIPQFTYNVLVAKKNVRITFTPEFPENTFGVYYGIHIVSASNVTITTFTRDNTNNEEVVLDLLGGQKINMIKRDYIANTIENYSIPMHCKYTAFDENVSYGDIYPLKQNLPDLTFIDLIKISATIKNTAIIYNEDLNKISFFDFSNWENPISIDDRLIKKGNVLRVFSDFAQKNIIKCKNSESVLPEKAVTKNFYVENETLEKEKELYTIPLSGGNFIGVSTAIDGFHKNLLLEDIHKELNEQGQLSYSYGHDADTICELVEGSDFLQQLIIDENPNFINTIGKSTKIEIDVKMHLFEYFKIKYNSTFIHMGIKYCVVEAKWTNNTASLTLQKI